MDQIRITGLVAGADLSAKQYMIVSYASTAGEVIAAAGTNETYVGILQNDPGDGEAAEIVVGGESYAVASDGSITVGLALDSDSTGRVNSTATDDRNIIGRALEASAAAGDLIRIQVTGLSRF